MKNFLYNPVRRIFIMLGSRCNMHCRYCLQQCQIPPELPQEINPDIYDFIEECIRRNPEDDKYISVTFFGGEPTLYFDKIKVIVDEMKRRDVTDLGFGIISNGKAITEDMVSYFNKNNISVSVSWDGPNTKDTRYIDVFEKNKDVIMDLDYLALSSVISAKAYPKEVMKASQKLFDEYYELHKYPLSSFFEFIVDTGISDASLIYDVDYDRIEKEFYELMEEMISSDHDTGKEVTYSWMNNFYHDIVECGATVLDIEMTPCGNGYDVINIDLDGNLYSCHNIFEPIGNINMPYIQYIKKIIKEDNTIKNLEGCVGCVAFPFCKGGCKLLEPGSEAKKAYCNIRIAAAHGMRHAIRDYLCKKDDLGLTKIEADRALKALKGRDLDPTEKEHYEKLKELYAKSFVYDKAKEEKQEKIRTLEVIKKLKGE